MVAYGHSTAKGAVVGNECMLRVAQLVLTAAGAAFS